MCVGRVGCVDCSMFDVTMVTMTMRDEIFKLFSYLVWFLRFCFFLVCLFFLLCSLSFWKKKICLTFSL